MVPQLVTIPVFGRYLVVPLAMQAVTEIFGITPIFPENKPFSALTLIAAILHMLCSCETSGLWVFEATSISKLIKTGNFTRNEYKNATRIFIDSSVHGRLDKTVRGPVD